MHYKEQVSLIAKMPAVPYRLRSGENDTVHYQKNIKDDTNADYYFYNNFCNNKSRTG